jgi:acyl-coenzyme A thioesterase PaaI-like protein
MEKSKAEIQAHLNGLYKSLKETFESIPFNQTLGLTLQSLSENEVVFTFKLNDRLLGNPYQKILHGGAICGAIDATGGAASTVGAYMNMFMRDASPEEFKRLEKIGTVGLHIDFLRPGVGETFTCKGMLNRAGSKIVSISMELRNEKDVLIAIGGGSFIH